MPQHCDREAALAAGRRQVQFAAEAEAEEDSEDETDGDGDSSEGDSETPPPRPGNAVEAMSYLYDAAGQLERAKGFGYTRGVQQLLATANTMLNQGDGDGRVDAVVALADGWLDDATEEMRAAGVVCGPAAHAARRLSVDVTADVIWVNSPNHWQHCTGRYKLDAKRVANGHPVWVMHARPDHYDPENDAPSSSQALRYLYSTPLGKWRVTNDPDDFEKGGGYLLSAEHNGAPPHLIESWWIKGAEDAAVVVTAQLGAAVAFTDDDLDPVEVFPIITPCAGRVQYAVNGVPRPPAASVCFSYEPTPTLTFPELETEIALDPSTVHRTLLALQHALRGCSVHAVLPRNVWKAWLSCWDVLAPQRTDGVPYYYHVKTRKTTWDLAAELAKCVAEAQ
eukprot:TRINITY_DN2195_c0_g1_i1.p1 TRINITY_DN2195_c0_g1~~TRINITY_DN2195_c0_g1_i1.p1  ORF type:complete len:394 (+),score=121.55 TRINITY_DN2195_c0_g1_i1:55-1236(+)